MLGTFTLLAAVGALINNVSLSTAWVHDYRTARDLGLRQQKPLAIFVGRGGFDWRSAGTISTRSFRVRMGSWRRLALRRSWC